MLKRIRFLCIAVFISLASTALIIALLKYCSQKDIEDKRMAEIGSKVANLAILHQTSGLNLENDREYALWRSGNGDTVYYKNITIFSIGSAELGIFIKGEEADAGTFYYGVDLPTSNLYVIDKNMSNPQVFKKPFKRHMTRNELLKIFDELSRAAVFKKI